MLLLAARPNVLWLLVAPKIISIASRVSAEEIGRFSIATRNLPVDVSSKFLLSGGDHVLAILKSWYTVFGTACELPSFEILATNICQYDTTRWDWLLAANFNFHSVTAY